MYCLGPLEICGFIGWALTDSSTDTVLTDTLFCRCTCFGAHGNTTTQPHSKQSATWTRTTDTSQIHHHDITLQTPKSSQPIEDSQLIGDDPLHIGWTNNFVRTSYIINMHAVVCALWKARFWMVLGVRRYWRRCSVKLNRCCFCYCSCCCCCCCSPLRLLILNESFCSRQCGCDLARTRYSSFFRPLVRQMWQDFTSEMITCFGWVVRYVQSTCRKNSSNNISCHTWSAELNLNIATLSKLLSESTLAFLRQCLDRCGCRPEICQSETETEGPRHKILHLVVIVTVFLLVCACAYDML